MKKYKIPVGDIVSKAKGRGLVRLIPENGFDSSKMQHPLHKYFVPEGIVYYFEGEGVGKKSDYQINLNEIEVVY